MCRYSISVFYTLDVKGEQCFPGDREFLFLLYRSLGYSILLSFYPGRAWFIGAEIYRRFMHPVAHRPPECFLAEGATQIDRKFVYPPMQCYSFKVDVWALGCCICCVGVQGCRSAFCHMRNNAALVQLLCNSELNYVDLKHTSVKRSSPKLHTGWGTSHPSIYMCSAAAENP